MALLLAGALPAMGAAPATSDWNGVNITAAPSITVGLRLAHAYWHTTVPATVTIVEASGYFAVAETPSADRGYGRHIGVTPLALATWPAGSTARRTQLAALVVHEYGHLLGYRDGIVYSGDPRHVMLEYSNYLFLQSEPRSADGGHLVCSFPRDGAETAPPPCPRCVHPRSGVLRRRRHGPWVRARSSAARRAGAP